MRPDWAPILTSEVMARARDITVVRMRRHGVPWRRIAEYLNTPVMTLKYRYDNLSPETVYPNIKL